MPVCEAEALPVVVLLVAVQKLAGNASLLAGGLVGSLQGESLSRLRFFDTSAVEAATVRNDPLACTASSMLWRQGISVLEHCELSCNETLDAWAWDRPSVCMDVVDLGEQHCEHNGGHTKQCIFVKLCGPCSPCWQCRLHDKAGRTRATPGCTPKCFALTGTGVPRQLIISGSSFCPACNVNEHVLCKAGCHSLQWDANTLSQGML